MTSPKLTQIDMMVRVEYHGEPVLLTKQLAQALSTPEQSVSESQLRMNFKNNESRYVEGKHYFKLEGTELAEFKKHAKNLYDVLKGTARLILWTKRGVARHCKSVGTDIAWHIFELLEDNYFEDRKNFCLPEPVDDKTLKWNRLKRQIKVRSLEVAVVYCLLLGDGTVKIGYTKNLSERMKQVALERGEEILDYKSTPFMNLDDARALEERLKEKYAAFCLGGEYFEVLFREVCAELQTA